MNTLPHGGLALSALDEQLLQPGVKGLPITEPLRQGAIGVQGWNVLRGDTSFPVALLKQSALRHNLDWMRRFCERFGATLAPHGKTTMSPQLFGAQLANGAWGITLATVAQVQVAHRFGVRRVLLANQLVARADIHSLLALLADDPDFVCYVLVDSVAGMALLSQAASARKLRLPVLVELGIAGKRAGCRTPAQALALAREAAAAPGLQLAGVEGYEGLLTSADPESDARAVAGFVDQLAQLVRQIDVEGLFDGAEILLSAGGSAYFDLVAQGFAGVGALSRPLRPVLRSGCYLTGDHGSYQRLLAQLDQRERAQRELNQREQAQHEPTGRAPVERDLLERDLLERDAFERDMLERESTQLGFTDPSPTERGSARRDDLDALPDNLRPALEVWSVVLSRPEPGLAILGMGKRDASYDIDLPIPLVHHRPGPGAPRALPAACKIIKLNDQHAYLHLPEGDPLGGTLAVGDLIGCGISHPCTTFDKWPVLLLVDDDYTVRQAINTFF
jgi:D-serine dehydratase